MLGNWTVHSCPGSIVGGGDSCGGGLTKMLNFAEPLAPVATNFRLYFWAFFFRFAGMVSWVLAVPLEQGTVAGRPGSGLVDENVHVVPLATSPTSATLPRGPDLSARPHRRPDMTQG